MRNDTKEWQEIINDANNQKIGVYMLKETLKGTIRTMHNSPKAKKPKWAVKNINYQIYLEYTSKETRYTTFVVKTPDIEDALELYNEIVEMIEKQHRKRWKDEKKTSLSCV